MYFCINCGREIKSLYKKYSETVLKLTDCEKCKQIADKYVEYDLVIIIIDLILLNMMAYRHILLNSPFKNFWKLSLILILLEAYSTWALSNRSKPELLCNKTEKSEPNLTDFDMNVEDFRFYVICINVALSSLLFISTIYVFTKLYHSYFSENNNPVTYTVIAKTITLSSTGILLRLPSIIWDISVYDYHLHFITLYTSLSQLLAYRVICNCPKIWCLTVIFTSHFLKSNASTYLSLLMDQAFFIK